MSPEEREAIYDREIAPALMALCKRCEDAGMSFLAKVEWAPDEGGSTMSVRQGRRHGRADDLVGNAGPRQRRRVDLGDAAPRTKARAQFCLMLLEAKPI